MDFIRNGKIIYFLKENNRNNLFFRRNDETFVGDHDSEEMPQKAQNKEVTGNLFLWDTRVVMHKQRNITLGPIHCFFGHKKISDSVAWKDYTENNSFATYLVFCSLKYHGAGLNLISQDFISFL